MAPARSTAGRAAPAVARRSQEPVLMALSDPHRWVETGDRRRHAVAAEVVFAVGDAVSTFCGVEATVDIGDVCHQGLFPECAACDDAVRELLGLPSRAAIAKLSCVDGGR